MTGVPSRASAPAAADFAGRTRHHIALRLLPFVYLLYVTKYLDRTSVAYAAIGMARDLGFDDRVFGLGIGIFFLSYVALPSRYGSNSVSLRFSRQSPPGFVRVRSSARSRAAPVSPSH